MSLGYSDEQNGAWGVMLRAVDPAGRFPIRYVRLASCPPDIQRRLLPHLKRLAADVVARARERADLLEQTIGDAGGA